jgi:hypothetical protein
LKERSKAEQEIELASKTLSDDKERRNCVAAIARAYEAKIAKLKEETVAEKSSTRLEAETIMKGISVEVISKTFIGATSTTTSTDLAKDNRRSI